MFTFWQRFAGDLGIRHAHAKRFLHADDELEGINGIQAKPLRAEKGRSSAISSAVTCSMRFLTSISLMRVRRSGSDI